MFVFIQKTQKALDFQGLLCSGAKLLPHYGSPDRVPPVTLPTVSDSRACANNARATRQSHRIFARKIILLQKFLLCAFAPSTTNFATLSRYADDILIMMSQVRLRSMAKRKDRTRLCILSEEKHEHHQGFFFGGVFILAVAFQRLPPRCHPQADALAREA